MKMNELRPIISWNAPNVLTDEGYEGDVKADYFVDPTSLENRSPRKSSPLRYPVDLLPNHLSFVTTPGHAPESENKTIKDEEIPTIKEEILPILGRPTASSATSASIKQEHSPPDYQVSPQEPARTPGRAFEGQDAVPSNAEGPSTDMVSIIRGRNADRATRIAPATIMAEYVHPENWYSDTEEEDWSQLHTRRTRS